MAVVVLGLLAGLWLVIMGLYGASRSERSPETPAGHWLSFPAGRRIGGILTACLGAAIILASLSL